VPTSRIANAACWTWDAVCFAAVRLFVVPLALIAYWVIVCFALAVFGVVAVVAIVAQMFTGVNRAD